MAMSDKDALNWFKAAKASTDSMINSGKNPALAAAEAAFKSSWVSPEVKRLRAAVASVNEGQQQQEQAQAAAQATAWERRGSSAGNPLWPTSNPPAVLDEDEGLVFPNKGGQP